MKKIECVLAVALVLARAFDLWTTWRVTPDLQLEANPLIRWVGWRWTIVLNVIACAVMIGQEWWLFAWVLMMLSIVAGGLNLRIKKSGGRQG